MTYCDVVMTIALFCHLSYRVCVQFWSHLPEKRLEEMSNIVQAFFKAKNQNMKVFDNRNV